MLMFWWCLSFYDDNDVLIKRSEYDDDDDVSLIERSEVADDDDVLWLKD